VNIPNKCDIEGHDWKFIKDWYGDPSIPNGTCDCSHFECRVCGEEADEVDGYEVEESDGREYEVEESWP
jgi:hypothetical protein